MSSISILAHEIGHHLCGHTTMGAKDLPDQRKKELEADKFSGFVMFKLGATLHQAQAAIRLIAINADDTFSTHPNLNKRLFAIANGYNDAKAQQPITKIDKSPSAERFANEGEYLFNQKDYLGAINKYSAAIRIKPTFANAYFYRGAAKSSLKDYHGAIEDLDKAIQINEPDNSNNAVGYSFRGVMKFYELNDKSEGCLDIQKACILGLNSACEVYNKICK